MQIASSSTEKMMSTTKVLRAYAAERRPGPEIVDL